VPIAAGGSTASLLVPLYIVVAGGVLGHAVPRLLGSDDDAPHPARALEWLLAGYLVLYAVQASWSADFPKALQQIAFFYVPFALLFCLLREVDWTPRLVAACLGVLVALAVIFAGVGFVEYARKQLFLNPRIIAANEFSSYFRVNSLFFDPNIYGRFLAMVMLALATVALWRTRLRDVLVAGALLALLWAGLVLTLSQSSFAALLAGLAVLAALRWSVRWTIVATLAAVVVAGAFVLVAHSALKIDLNRGSTADRATSGRTALISGGWRLFEHRPVLGWGSASFALQYRAHESASSERAVSASHTIPVTVAAEQGLIGELAYLALVVAALITLLERSRADPARVAVAAAFLALLFHTLLYADFLEDPITWTLLAIGVALSGRPPPEPAPADRPPGDRQLAAIRT
jgi:O-antigen ligase